MNPSVVARNLFFLRATRRAAHKDMNAWFTLVEGDAAVQVGDATIRIDQSSPEPTIVVRGRITVASSPRVRSALFELLRKNAWCIVIDLV